MRARFLTLLVVLFASVLPHAVARAADFVPTSMSLLSNANPAAAGEAVTLTATVTDASGGGATPTGTVSFDAFDRGPLGSVALVGGKATLTVALSAGVHFVSAFYSGEGTSFLPSGASVTQRWGALAPSLVELFSSANPAPTGFGVTLTASVRPAEGSGVATGSVTFRDGATDLGTATLANAEFGEEGIIPSASITVSNLLAGTHSITAVYSGDGNLLSGTSLAVAQVIGQPMPTATRLDTGSTPQRFAVSGQFFSFSVSVFAGFLRASGMVTLLEGSTVLGSGELNDGSVSVDVTGRLLAGTHQVVASYAGDGTTFASSVSSPETVTVVDAGGPNPSVLTATATPSSIAFGQSTTVTATVAANPAFPTPGTPTGTITFWSGGSNLGSAPLDAGGSASLTVQPRAFESVTAIYSGDATFSAAIGGAFSLFVNSMPTTVDVTSSVNPAGLGQPVTLTAHVTPATAATPGLSGTVVFTDGLLKLSRVPLDAAGTATLTLTLPPDRHTILAHYDGNQDYSSSQVGLTQVVLAQRATTVGLTSSTNPSQVGQEVEFTATVRTPTPSGPSLTGAVSFRDGTTVLGQSKLRDGVARLEVERLTAGSHTITASYSGDPNYAPSTSPVLNQVVQPRS